MRLKKLGVAMLAVFVLGAIAANSAFATNEFGTEASAWYVGGSKLAEGTTKTLTTEAVGTEQTLTTTVAGEPLKLKAKKVSCSSCGIKNVGTSAKGEGALVFEEVSVVEPKACSTASTITSKALTMTVGMDKANTLATVKFVPTAGATKPFATVELTGLECAIAGPYNVTGTQYGQATNATGKEEATQEIKVSEAIQKSAGEATSLKFGVNAAILNGAIKGSIGGTAFGANEK